MSDPSDRPGSGSEPPPPAEIPPTMAQSTELAAGSTALWPPPFGPLPCRLGRYELQRQLGRGGMGTVYFAHDPVLDIPVALKVPHPEIASDPHALDRVYREARAAARLAHPHICRVFDVGCADGRHYLAMAYVEGESLAALVASFAGGSPRAAELVRKVALAVEEAHRQGVVHRDLKPHNIMIDRRGEPVVMDFGLARRVEAPDATQTQQGAVLGTPVYMPPEQAAGEVDAVGPPSDVYSLGAVLYELLAGRPPFSGPVGKVLAAVLHDDPPPPSTLREGVDMRLEAVCLRAMAKRREERYASMAEFAAALELYLMGGGAGGEDRQGPAPVRDVQFPNTVLASLRAHGWHKGLRLARERVVAADAGQRQAVELILGWLGGDDRLHEQALEQLGEGATARSLTAWALLGQAFAALDRFDYRATEELFGRTTAFQRRLQDAALGAHLAYLEGVLLSRQGRWEEAVAPLHAALGTFGRKHFATGRVLDWLGRVYAGKCNFDAAREFHQQAIVCKKDVGDEAGLLLSHEHAGRLFLDWGQLDKAEELLQAGLRLAQRAGDDGAQAQLFNHLGRVAMARGEREAAVGRRSAARRHWNAAREYFDWSIGYNERHGRGVQEGRARHDAATLCLNEGDVGGAEAHLRRSEELLRQANFDRGLAEVRRVRARVCVEQAAHDEALHLLRQALAHYDGTHERIEAARTQLEIARALSAARSPSRLVLQALEDALQRAEACRRGDLVEAAQEELRGVDEEAHWRHVFRRVRGHGAPEATASLSTGTSEPATVLFLNLQHFVPFCQGLDPEQVMVTLNQLLADLEGVLERHGALVTAYLGGGFMALLREAGHAERAVSVALELVKVLAEFNRPREILGLRQLPGRVGVASGMVFLGNIGTYRKMDFTAVGVPVNLAARLMRQADTSAPCVSQETRELVGDRFAYREGSPRVVELPGIGQRPVWDVVGRTGGVSPK